MHKQRVHRLREEYGDYYNELFIELVDLMGKFHGDTLDEAELRFNRPLGYNR